VAHRLRTIYDSDQILVLKDGQVAEMGLQTNPEDG
jgi:ABC transporter ATM